MASAFEGGLQVFVHDGIGFFVGDEAARHDEHVGVVVLTGEVGYLGHPAEGSTYALMFVERHADAFSAAADGNAFFAFARLHATCQGVAEIGIVATFGAICSVVVIGNAFLVEIRFHVLLEGKACMVACKSEWFHYQRLEVSG